MLARSIDVITATGDSRPSRVAVRYGTLAATARQPANTTNQASSRRWGEPHPPTHAHDAPAGTRSRSESVQLEQTAGI